MRHETVYPLFRSSSVYVSGKKIAQTEIHVDQHFHKECELYYLSDGIMTYTVADTCYNLSAGDIIFIGSNVPHSTFRSLNSCGMLLQFEQDFGFLPGQQYFVQNGKNREVTLLPAASAQNKQIRQCLEEINTEWRSRAEFYDAVIRAECEKIEALLCRYGVFRYHFKQEEYDYLMREVLEFTQQHYTESLTLHDAARVMNVTDSHFCRVFKKTTGCTYFEYLNYLRIAKACELLVSTKMSVNEIAECTGFSSFPYFSKIFRRIKHCTPSVYRKMAFADSGLDENLVVRV